MPTLTRAGLAEAVHREVGLPRAGAAEIVAELVETIVGRLAAGKPVGIAGFGSFVPRDKGTRPGRNPRTGETVRIAARRVVAFRPSPILKDRVQARSAEDRERA